MLAAASIVLLAHASQSAALVLDRAVICPKLCSMLLAAGTWQEVSQHVLLVNWSGVLIGQHEPRF